jgi:hypothetical protein
VVASDLIGRWSNFDLYIGSQQQSQMFFMADGVGWSEFWNGGGSEQHRFRWAVRDERLTLEINRYAWVELLGVDYAPPQEREDRRSVELTYSLEPGQDAFGRDRTILTLDQAISFSHRFAHERRELRPVDDMVGWALP